MSLLSDAQNSFLCLFAECGWASGAMLELTGYSYTYRTRCLKMLLDQQYIRKEGKGRTKAYALTAKGRNHLAGMNAIRFREEVMDQTRQLSRHPGRSVLRGDAAAMFSLAGYAVHMDDKPPLPATTPTMPENPSHENWARLCQNAVFHSYPDTKDMAVYWRRLSPVGCYYDATAIKELAGPDFEGVSYSRACGVLVTPSFLFRVYHSRDVAMKFQLTGERNLHDLLLAEQVFRGYLPKQNNAVLIFGTDFTAAKHILGHYMNGQSARMPVCLKRGDGKRYAKVKGTVGEMLTPTNLGKPAFYLPLSAESQPLLRLMQYPFWQDELIREICREVFGLSNQTRWRFELDGTAVFILAAMNLTQAGFMLRTFKTYEEKPSRIICLDWQEPLFRELLEPFSKQWPIRITRLPATYMEDLLNRFEAYWGGGQ